MNPWLKTVLVGGVITIAAFAYLFILPAFISALKPDPFGEAILPIMFMLALGLQFLALFSAWASQRWMFKGTHKYIVSVLFAVLVSFGAFLVFLLSTHGWSWSLSFYDFEFFGFFPAIMCGVPLLYLIFCKKTHKPRNEALER
jgi:hypothetical protein